MLKDLKELLKSTQDEIQSSLNNIKEIEFSVFFKEYYKKHIAKEASFLKNTAIIPTATKTIIAPSLWFYVSAQLTDLLEELIKYKKSVVNLIEETKVIDIQTEFESWADEIRKNNKDIEDKFIRKSIDIYGKEDTDKIRRFLTDYSYWGGGKSIGRSQDDFSHSVLLKASGLLNESSGAVSWFTDILLKHHELKKDILDSVSFSKLPSFEQKDFNLSLIIENLSKSGLIFNSKLITRFVASLLTKPFVILSGLSGSGKTKLAQAFAQWICQNESQYCLVPVGADWTNREPLLGYPNALKTDEYIKPDNTALDVIISANNQPELPHFLILDEMNLSHVERYFADFLSVMESKGEISLYSEGTVNNGVPSKLTLPPNLFVIGTVNIDETTYMFSPKVLDRANAIEFRVTKEEMKNFFTEQQEVDMNKLRTQGASMAQSFLSLAGNKTFANHDLTEIQETLLSFFAQLKKTGAEFGYRSASEIIRLINQLTVIDADLTKNEKLDIAIMQKLLPKLHGSRRKLCPVLESLAGFCVDNEKIKNIEKEIFSNDKFDFETNGVLFPISLEKITRMYNGAIENGFASYAEA